MIASVKERTVATVREIECSTGAGMEAFHWGSVVRIIPQDFGPVHRGFICLSDGHQIASKEPYADLVEEWDEWCHGDENS